MDQYISLGHLDALELSSLSIPLSPYLCNSAASHPDTWTVCRPVGKLCLDYNVLLQVQIQKKMVFGKLAWADTQITKMLFGWLHERMQPVQHVRLTCGALTLQLHPPSAGPDWPGMLKTSASMEPASNRIFVPPCKTLWRKQATNHASVPESTHALVHALQEQWTKHIVSVLRRNPSRFQKLPPFVEVVGIPRLVRPDEGPYRHGWELSCLCPK
jgi:hypothetical protein